MIYSFEYAQSIVSRRVNVKQRSRSATAVTLIRQTFNIKKIYKEGVEHMAVYQNNKADWCGDVPPR